MSDDLRERATAVIAHHFGLEQVDETAVFGKDLKTGDEEDSRLHMAELHFELENALEMDLPDFPAYSEDYDVTVKEMVDEVVRTADMKLPINTF